MKRDIRFYRARIVLRSVAMLLLLSSISVYASVFGAVKVIVHDPQHRPVQGAEVVIQSRSSALKLQGKTNADGVATVLNVPAGEYNVTITAAGFSAEPQPITVASDNVQELHIALTVAAAKETVEVSGTPELINPSSSTTTTLVNRTEIAHTPGADRTNSLSVITDFVPGAYIVHDQLHVRGGHQVTWAIDGIPVPNTNIATNVGPQFDPKDIDYIEAQRGSYSAESGDRTYGVFNVVPRSGFERDHQAELLTSYGSYNFTDNQLSFGDHSDRSAYYFSLNGNRTDYGLETPTSKIFHDQAAGGGAFTSLIFNVTPGDQLRFTGSARSDYYQVPNDPDAQAAGVRDREREQDVFGNFSWVHTVNSATVLTISPLFHFNRAAFEGGPLDVPSATANRASYYAGGQASIAVIKGSHNMKVGAYAFAQHDNTLFSLVANDGSGQALSQRQKVGGDLEALFVEDQYKATSWLTLNAGVRFTRFAGLLPETAGSPRLGAAIRIPRINWVLRGSYSRYYEAPPLDTLSGPLLQFALDQGVAFIPLRGERDEQHEVGLSIPVKGWVFDFDHFRTGAHNFFDHDVLENSNIFLPLTIESVRIMGYEATVRSPQVFHRLDAHLAYSHQSVEGTGGVTGGLTDFSSPREGFFFLDHDQRHTLSTGFTLQMPRRSWLSGNFSYGSGFVNGDGPEHLPSYRTMDLSVGKSFGENWSAKITATNLANKRYFIDLSNTFGGSHFADPRQISAQLRYRFHY
ncbi:MAG: TonB-dependent receptor [Candidatus Angelobacter sp. Gp1-AA117]|nr:MAG: TonB-dependent receptor [Candidatus Angelobacter sp. Gp1-AA117]